MIRRSLILGAGGQDGRLLAAHLAKCGDEVHGGFRVVPSQALAPEVAHAHVCDVTSKADLEKALAASRPDRIFFLAGQSSVGASFDQPVETWNSCATGLVILLSLMKRNNGARLVFAGSGECFGETVQEAPATELSSFRPLSPYAAAKCAAHHALAAARAAGIHACTAFLFSHESPFRPETFVIGKALAAARRIAQGSPERLALGNIDVIRDWGWAPDYVKAMVLMSETDAPEDFIIATGHSYSLRDMVAAIFSVLGLDLRKHVDVGEVVPRPSDIATQYADPAKARRVLGWRSEYHGQALAQKLVAGAI